MQRKGGVLEAQKEREAGNNHKLKGMGKERDELFVRYRKLKENLDNVRRRFIESIGGPIKFDDTDGDENEVRVYYKGKIVWKIEMQEEIDHTLDPYFQYVPLKEDSE